MRPFLLLLLVPLLAACGDSTGPISAEEVGGVYQICSLAFTPGGALQPVDIRVAAMAASPPPLLTLSNQIREFELEYRLPGDQLAQRPRGSYETGAGSVTLVFTEPARASALLLPARLRLDVQQAPQALTVSTQQPYNVTRTDYARLAGISEVNLSPEITGTVSGRFVITGSPCS
ncbi:hypothetical protein BH23GEM5_BH23GEM5_04310 [soil metagenome]